MRIWLKNTSGKQDAVLTMAFLGFLVVLWKVLFGGIAIPIWAGKTIMFPSIDPGTIGALITPTLGAYVARKYTDANSKHPAKDPSGEK